MSLLSCRKPTYNWRIIPSFIKHPGSRLCRIRYALQKIPCRSQIKKDEVFLHLFLFTEVIRLISLHNGIHNSFRFSHHT